MIQRLQKDLKGKEQVYQSIWLQGLETSVTALISTHCISITLCQVEEKKMGGKGRGACFVFQISAAKYLFYLQ